REDKARVRGLLDTDDEPANAGVDSIQGQKADDVVAQDGGNDNNNQGDGPIAYRLNGVRVRLCRASRRLRLRVWIARHGLAIRRLAIWLRLTILLRLAVGIRRILRLPVGRLSRGRLSCGRLSILALLIWWIGVLALLSLPVRILITLVRHCSLLKL